MCRWLIAALLTFVIPQPLQLFHPIGVFFHTFQPVSSTCPPILERVTLETPVIRSNKGTEASADISVI